MPDIKRRKTPTVKVGNFLLGSDHPVAVQSMTDTPTADIGSTLAQTVLLAEAGAELVRWTINDDAAAAAAVQIIRRLREAGLTTAFIGDFHFNGHLILEKHPDLAELLDKYRINPGNVGKGSHHDRNFARIIEIAVKNRKAVRIGVNWGSLDQEILKTMLDANLKSTNCKDITEVMFDTVLESALESARYALELGLPEEKLVLSAKLSTMQDMVEVNTRLAERCHYVLHLGLTEAGGGIKGIASSVSALAVLLHKGIGDTIRVSLTPEPGALRSKEVEVCRELLQSMGLRFFIPTVVSCPGCGRTQSAYFQELAAEIQKYLAERSPEWRKSYPGVEKLKVAVMGCVVNGPGESQYADIGISLPGVMEELAAPVYADGKKVEVLRGNNIKDQFIEILNTYIVNRFRK
jgi:(E)-4-hydroxy-3-methylbut-2-enyl-diphosphate synthase